MSNSLLQKVCLKPRSSLRRQLLVSFGTTSFVAIGFVIIIATLSAKFTGDYVKSEAQGALGQHVKRNIHLSSGYIAQTIGNKFNNIGSAADLIAEITRDRIVGYPNDGYENDAHVPFLDEEDSTATTNSEKRRNCYPLLGHSLPPDWNIQVNINESNAGEHLQERSAWYEAGSVSTISSMYHMQGQCDPSQHNSSTKTFFPNCTDANNDITTGGVVQPTSTNVYLAGKSADISILLKPIYESHNHIKNLGVFFSNSGAGSFVEFPSSILDGKSTYTSIGCDWMKEANPFTGLPFASREEIDRCHPKGALVPGREYNALERGWCRDQALNPDRRQITGPYQDAFQKDGLWLLTFGRAIFDRKTGHFIGCTLLDVPLTRVAECLTEAKVLRQGSYISLFPF